MNIFYNSLGEFQWASIAALIAGFSAIISLLFSILGYCNSKKALKYQIIIDQKKIDADIIAKSRISWNQDTRQVASEIINEAYMCFRTLKSYAYKCYTYWSIDENQAYSPIYDKDVILNEIQKENEILSEEFDKHYEKFKKTSNQFKLFFGDNKENNILLEKVASIQEQIDFIDNFRHVYQKNIGFKESIELNESLNESTIGYDNTISQFTYSLRSYLKEEWMKAKKGE